MSSRAWLFFPLCILIFSLSVDAVEEASGKIIHVGKENTYEYQSIQEAIVVSSVGDTVFVHRGIYHESVVVSKAINLIGEDKNTTIIDGVERAIFVYCRGVKVSGFTIQNCDAGIFIESDGNIVSNNILKNNSRGIWGLESDNNIISDNILENNNQSIVLSLHSDNNTVSGNILKNNDRGITLGLGSSDNKITDNLIINSSYGVYLEDLCCNNIFSNNIIKNNEVGIYFSEGCKGNKLSNNTFLNNRKKYTKIFETPMFSPLSRDIDLFSMYSWHSDFCYKAKVLDAVLWFSDHNLWGNHLAYSFFHGRVYGGEYGGRTWNSILPLWFPDARWHCSSPCRCCSSDYPLYYY